MTLTVGDLVAVHNPATLPFFQGEPPMFGIVEAFEEGEGGTPWHIVWYDGKHITNVTADYAIDKIIAPTSNALLGEVVRIDLATLAPEASQEYTGVVDNVYARDLNGDQNPGPDMALVRCLSTGLFLEARTALCHVVAGR